MTEKSENKEKCPCGSDLLYSECCEPLHRGDKVALRAEQLMRSRYSAYVKIEIPYILETTFPDNRSDFDEKSMHRWAENSDWEKLEIISTKQGEENDNEGWVQFSAYYSEKSIKKVHNELSYFKKSENNWYFVSGKEPLINKINQTVSQKVGRNDPCPCGSGKKYKKCCG